jgi:hypothetical protein
MFSALKIFYVWLIYFLGNIPVLGRQLTKYPSGSPGERRAATYLPVPYSMDREDIEPEQ